MAGYQLQVQEGIAQFRIPSCPVGEYQDVPVGFPSGIQRRGNSALRLGERNPWDSLRQALRKKEDLHRKYRTILRFIRIQGSEFLPSMCVQLMLLPLCRPVCCALFSFWDICFLHEC